ncbi:19208_t:CDS:2 [Entrophospora sp. SA101]|nr:22969_t:CDS:2 [Entrophospora sp. SA101]CAJ0766295.1 19208_t:CDS:2 [Entrophospora sp. SA101]CAJ0829540.1 3536_t:CDS:2 [Entrophospora sp. SA101]CAJ0829546.1 3538_t:CDS:2 [Entrophospora sp. SA101]CAJ0924586.1 17826_t:CDS:2 [Entrophospora sp. SA101]
MSILPITSPRNSFNEDVYPYKRRSSYWTASIPIFLRRLFRFPQMTKNQWARDDPAFVVILSFLLGISAIAWGIVYGHGIVGIFKMIAFMVFVDFVIVGLFISSVCW